MEEGGDRDGPKASAEEEKARDSPKASVKQENVWGFQWKRARLGEFETARRRRRRKGGDRNSPKASE